MQTITVHSNFHWKALQLNGERWRCDACDVSHATNLVTWLDHVDRVIFEIRYCRSCLPEILSEPPIDLRITNALGR